MKTKKRLGLLFTTKGGDGDVTFFLLTISGFVVIVADDCPRLCAGTGG